MLFGGGKSSATDGRKNVGAPFPFRLEKSGGALYVFADIESEPLYPDYVEFFEKHGYTGNGYTWEGHISAILRELDPALLERIDFDPEAGMFAAEFTSRQDRDRFVALLSPIFSDLPTLETWVAKADRDAIED